MRLTEAQRELDDFVQYVKDYNFHGGGFMREKYGDNPFDGFTCVVRRAEKLHRIVSLALADKDLTG